MAETDEETTLSAYATPLVVVSGLPFPNSDLEVKPRDSTTSVSKVSSEKGKESTISFPSTTFLCDICADEKPNADEAFTIVGCNHSYCSDCVAKYVDSKLQESVVLIACPVSGCKGSLEPEICQSILPKQVFDRWCDALCESLIVGSEKIYCPFKDCSALLIDARFENEGVLECECPECHRLFCALCKVPWHSSLTCDEYQNLNEHERSNEDIKMVNLAKVEKWMRCPHCRYYVQRSQGCLFIKCRCGHGFCYNCGAPMEEHYCRKCKH